MSLLQPLLTLASPAGARNRLSVLVLHRVLAGPDPLVPEAIDAARFTEMCRWLGAMFNVVPLDVAMRQLARGELPSRALAITFDDGYADNHDVALPILNHFGMPATVFVTTGFLDGGCMWNDVIIESLRRTRQLKTDLGQLLPPGADCHFMLDTPAQRRHALDRVIDAVKYLEPDQRLSTVRRLAEHLEVDIPTDLMMRSDQVVALHRGGLQVGAHTVSHPILTRIGRDAALGEMRDSKLHLERLLGEPVPLFAYPNGRPGVDFDDTSVALARQAGFEAAVTTERGAASAHTNPFCVPRFTPWDRSRTRFGIRMLSTLWTSRNAGTALASA